MDAESEAATLYTSLGASFGVCVCLVFIWKFLIAPAIPAYGALAKLEGKGEDERVFLASSFVSFYPACTAPFLAMIAARDIPFDDNATVMTAAPSQLALQAVGISCGYMLYDTFYCLLHKQARLQSLRPRSITAANHRLSATCRAGSQSLDHRPSRALRPDLALRRTPAPRARHDPVFRAD